jgi:DNA adenine methylase
MVLVIGVLGAWGKGKTLTLTMLQELAKSDPLSLGFKQAPIIASNYLSKFMDWYVQINPKIPYVKNPFRSEEEVPVVDLFSFLDQPKSERTYFLFLDDVYAWLASYFFGSSFNQAAFRLLAAGRKKNINIGESSVRFKDVDPRLRALHTHLFLPSFHEESQTVTIERYRVDAFEDVKINPDVYFDASRYWDAYDTTEIIQSVYDRPRPRVASPAPVSVPRSSRSPSPSSSFLPLTTPSRRGLEAFEGGIAIQNRVASLISEALALLPEGNGRYDVENHPYGGAGVKEPDIVIWREGKPVAVISVKSHTLHQSRWVLQPDGTRRAQLTEAKTYYYSDVDAEVEYARREGIPCYLIFVNSRNSKAALVKLDTSRQYGQKDKVFTTPSWIKEGQELNDQVPMVVKAVSELIAPQPPPPIPTPTPELAPIDTTRSPRSLPEEADMGGVVGAIGGPSPAGKPLTFFPYAAGKSKLIEFHLAILPAHICYVEVFGGAGTLLLNKPRAKVEVYNDIQGDLVNVFRAVKAKPEEVQRVLDSLPRSREVYSQLLDYFNSQGRRSPSVSEEPDFKRAAYFLYCVSSSFGGTTPQESTPGNFGVGTTRDQAGTLRRRTELLSEIGERLKNVTIENRSFEDIIRLYDRPGTLLYLDPPYYAPGQAQGGGITMPEEKHRLLAELLSKCQSRFILNYDDCEPIRELYRGFYRRHIESIKTGEKILSTEARERATVSHIVVTNFIYKISPELEQKYHSYVIT